ncbi:MAG: 50S ribosomal protein L29 [Bacteroidota bacterium]
MAKKESYNGYTKSDLVTKIGEEKLNYKKMKFTHAISSSESPIKLRGQRREIARMLTELNKRKD